MLHDLTSLTLALCKFYVSANNLATAQAFFEACPEALSDFHVKLARYDITLQTLIYHEEGRKYFTKYLQSEYSEENIKFWKVCGGSLVDCLTLPLSRSIGDLHPAPFHFVNMLSFLSLSGRERIQRYSRLGGTAARGVRSRDFSEISCQGRVRTNQCQLAQHGRGHTKYGEGRGMDFHELIDTPWFSISEYPCMLCKARISNQSNCFCCSSLCVWKIHLHFSFHRRCLPSARPKSST
jgi:hypothetical protein